MAHIKAEVDADITPLEKKLRQAAEKAKEFAKETGKTLSEIGKETGLGDIGKFLGLGGAAASVGAFGVAIVEAIKGGVEEAAKFQTEAFQMGTVLKDMDLGEGMTDWAEKTDTAVGSAEERVQALQSLMQSGLNTDQAQAEFKQLADVVAGAGGNLPELAEGFRKMSIGQGEEKTSGMQRIMKGSGAIEQMVRDDKKDYEEQLRAHLAGIPRMMTTGPQVAEEEANLKKVQGMSLTDYSKQFLKPADITNMLARATGAGGQYEGKAAAKGETYEGALAAAKQAVLESEREIGKVILPTLTTWLKTLTKDLQDNAPLFKTLGEDIQVVLDIIGNLGGKAEEGAQAFKSATGPAFLPLLNALMSPVTGPANAVGITLMQAIFEHIKSSSDTQKETRDILKATFPAS